MSADLTGTTAEKVGGSPRWVFESLQSANEKGGERRRYERNQNAAKEIAKEKRKRKKSGRKRARATKKQSDEIRWKQWGRRKDRMFECRLMLSHPMQLARESHTKSRSGREKRRVHWMENRIPRAEKRITLELVYTTYRSLYRSTSESRIYTLRILFAEKSLSPCSTFVTRVYMRLKKKKYPANFKYYTRDSRRRQEQVFSRCRDNGMK